MVLIGSMIGLYVNFPQAQVAGLALFGLFNAAFALLVCYVGVQVLSYFGVLKDHSQ
jgi:hypothetical protein